MGKENSCAKTKETVKKFLLLISLSTPFSRIFVFSSGIVLLASLPTEKLHYIPVRSVYESVFGFSSFSSGMTRAVSRILHGDLIGAYSFNPLAFLVMAIIAYYLIKDSIYLFRTRDFSI